MLHNRNIVQNVAKNEPIYLHQIYNTVILNFVISHNIDKGHLMPNVFISYARETQIFATKLARSLEQSGADVFLDIDDIPAGMNWSQAIQNGLDNAQVMLIVISPASMASKNVTQEWQYFADNGKVIIPIWFQPAKRHFQLQRMQYIDFHEVAYNHAYIRLLRALKGANIELEFPPDYDESSYIDTVPERPLALQKKSPGKNPLLIAGFLITFLIVASVLFVSFSGIFKGLNGTDGTRTLTSTVTQTLSVEQRAGATLDAIQTQARNDRQSTQEQSAIETALANRIATGTQSAFETQSFAGTETREAEFDNEVDASATSVVNTIVAISASQTLVTQSFASDTPTPTMPATATATITSVPLGFLGRSVTSNIEWIPVIQDFDGIDMLLVPAGCFAPGFNGRTEVCYNNPYWIDRTEVSNSQIGLAISRNNAPGVPAEFVTWDEANSFCAARGGRLPDANEWEYAARGPDNLYYPWGNQFNENLVVYNQNATSTTMVDSYHEGASWVGALHMSGNVWEWIVGGTATQRPNRGGSFDWFGGTTDPANDNLLTTASRSTDGTKRWYNIGFRCVRDIDTG